MARTGKPLGSTSPSQSARRQGQEDAEDGTGLHAGTVRRPAPRLLPLHRISASGWPRVQGDPDQSSRARQPGRLDPMPQQERSDEAAARQQVEAALGVALTFADLT